jgi:hypothetical protein
LAFRERVLLLITLAGPAIALIAYYLDSDSVRQAITVTLLDEQGPKAHVDIHLASPSPGGWGPCTGDAEGFRSGYASKSTRLDGSVEWHRKARRFEGSELEYRQSHNDFNVCMRVNARWQPLWSGILGTEEISRFHLRCTLITGTPPHCEMETEAFDRQRSNFRAFLYLLLFPQAAWGYRLRNVVPRQRTGAISAAGMVVFEAGWTLAYVGYDRQALASVGLSLLLGLWLVLVHREIYRRQ